MKCLFIATFAGAIRYCLQDSNGTLWLMNREGKIIKPEFTTEADGREMFTVHAWHVQTAPPQE